MIPSCERDFVSSSEMQCCYSHRVGRSNISGHPISSFQTQKGANEIPWAACCYSRPTPGTRLLTSPCPERQLHALLLPPTTTAVLLGRRKHWQMLCIPGGAVEHLCAIPVTALGLLLSLPLNTAVTPAKSKALSGTLEIAARVIIDKDGLRVYLGDNVLLKRCNGNRR